MPVLFLSTTNKTDHNRWDISALRTLMFHYKLDAICCKLFFFKAILFLLAIDLQRLFVKLCHNCNFSIKNLLHYIIFCTQGRILRKPSNDHYAELNGVFAFSSSLKTSPTSQCLNNTTHSCPHDRTSSEINQV